jgi:hypothetical protein
MMNLLSLGIAAWAVGIAVYLLLFAQLTYQGVTTTTEAGQPPVTTSFTRQERLITAAEPFTVVFILAFSAILAGGAFAARRGFIVSATVLAGISLVFSFISGFSIGLLYLPAALALTICALLLGIDRLARRP